MVFFQIQDGKVYKSPSKLLMYLMSLYEIKSDTALTQKAEEAALHIRVYKFSFENIFKRITDYRYTKCILLLIFIYMCSSIYHIQYSLNIQTINL